MEHFAGVPLDAIRVQCDQCLVGSKYAVQFGDGPILLSPAMFELVKHATPEELRTLLAAIRIKRLPAMPSFRELSMTTVYPGNPL
jgi:hypothetical protein